MQITKDIINKVHKRERTTCELLYKTYSGVCLGICMRYARNRADAHDMLQEGFLEVYKNIKSYRFSGSFEGWIKKIVFHQSINYIRKYYKQAQSFLEVEKLSIVQHAHDDFAENHLLKVISEIPEKYRIIFNLYAVEDYSHKEIAKMLKIEESSSRSQFHRARNLIKERLEFYDAYDNNLIINE